jgi:hypothetical protein
MVLMFSNSLLCPRPWAPGWVGKQCGSCAVLQTWSHLQEEALGEYLVFQALGGVPCSHSFISSPQSLQQSVITVVPILQTHTPILAHTEAAQSVFMFIFLFSSLTELPLRIIVIEPASPFCQPLTTQRNRCLWKMWSSVEEGRSEQGPDEAERKG